jgi:hypothetical protein
MTGTVYGIEHRFGKPHKVIAFATSGALHSWIARADQNCARARISVSLALVRGINVDALEPQTTVDVTSGRADRQPQP